MASRELAQSLKREADALGAFGAGSPIKPRKNAVQRFLSPAADFSEELVVGAADALDRIPGAKNKTLQNVIRIGAALPGEIAKTVPNIGPVQTAQWLAEKTLDGAEAFGESTESWINSEVPTPVMPNIAPAAPSVPMPVRNARSMSAAEFNQGGLGVVDTPEQMGNTRGGASNTEGARSGWQPPPSNGMLTGQALKDRFGYSEGPSRAGTDDAAARAGVLARGSRLDDPGADRRAAENARNRAAAAPGTILNEMFGVDPIPARIPSRQESAQEDDYIDLQVRQAEAAQGRVEQGIQQDQAYAAYTQAQEQAAAKLTAAQRREALRMALEEKLGMPLDDKALEEIAKQEFDGQQREDVLQDIFDLRHDEQMDIDAMAAGYPNWQTDPKQAEGKNAAAQLIREKYRAMRADILDIRTKQAVNRAKNPPGVDDIIGVQ